VRFVWLKVVYIDRSLLKGEAPRFSADFNYPLSYEKPLKFQRHLVRPLGIDMPCWTYIFIALYLN
jgi:hypothetical protein